MLNPVPANAVRYEIIEPMDAPHIGQKHDVITKNITWTQYCVYLFCGILILSGSLRLHMGNVWIEVGLFTGVAILFSAAMLLNQRRIERRKVQISQLIAAHTEYTAVPDTGMAFWFAKQLGAIDELHGARDQQISNVITTPDWTYGDFTYNLYGKLKHGEYVKATVYYGIMTTQLPRELPNVFFDSIKARHRQFRLHFAKNQRHSLEGDFDKFFVTYFPDGYTIDSMSFISPEVMWAMRSASDYDIEIYRNRLFLYGPLFDPEAQLKDMSTKLLEIKKQLIDNATTYRDERVPFAQGRKYVAVEAVSLKISNFWKWFSALTVIGYIILRIVLQYWFSTS